MAGLGGSKPSSSAVNVVSGIKTRQKEVGFQVLAGLAQKLEPSLQAGAVGAVLAFARRGPDRLLRDLRRLERRRRRAGALEAGANHGAAQRVGSELGIPGMKYGMDLNGYYGGPARLPLLPLTADLKHEVERLLADIRN